MRINLCILLLLTPFLFVGCLSPAQRLEPEVVRQVKEGLNRPEVEKIMGKPGSVVTGSGSHSVAHYGYIRRIESAEFALIGNLAKNPGDILLRHLSVLYNGKNTVEKVLFHQSLTPFKTGFGRVSAGQVVSADLVREIKKGTSTAGDLVKLFGEPHQKVLDVNGDLVMQWYYAKSQMGWVRNQNEGQTLSVTLDEAGLVKEHTLSGNVGP